MIPFKSSYINLKFRLQPSKIPARLVQYFVYFTFFHHVRCLFILRCYYCHNIGNCFDNIMSVTYNIGNCFDKMHLPLCDNFR